MPQYTILIYEDEANWVNATPEQFGAVMAAHDAFTAQIAEQGGSIVAGAGLQPTTTATTLRTNGAGSPVVTDGPFVETKEALGGFYVVEARDLDHALTIARLCPAGTGGVEVRPTIDPSQM